MSTMYLPEKPPVAAADIDQAVAGMAKLMFQGISAEDFIRYIGAVPEDLYRRAEDSADEEFDLHHGMGELSVGRLRAAKLTDEQSKHVKEALVDTAVLFFEVGMTLAYVRANVEPEGGK